MSRDVVLAAWAVVVASLIACQTVSAIRPNCHAGLRELIDTLRGGRFRNGLLVLGWMWLGWHFFAR